jgi:hypothetical protein
MNRFFNRVLGRLRWAAHWRCAEPLVLFECDDWGLLRKPCIQLLSNYGEPKDYARDRLETASDLERLYRVLEQFKDEVGRPACMTANFIVANPDFERIATSRFENYYEVPITENKTLKDKWLEGFDRKVFYPQYHGRSHFWPPALLRDLQADTPGVRELFINHCHGGLALLKDSGWRYHTEYLDWHSGKILPDPEQLLWLKIGLEYFHQTFKFSPKSTIAPHYIFNAYTCQAWRQVDFHFVQGTNYHILRNNDGSMRSLSHALGESSPEGLIFLARTVRFEPRPRSRFRDVDKAMQAARNCFHHHIPAVIESHRLNFTGPWQEQALTWLSRFFEKLSPYNPIFLTPVELGQAIAQNGVFQDVFTGEIRHLTPLDGSWRRSLRAKVASIHRFLEKGLANNI